MVTALILALFAAGCGVADTSLSEGSTGPIEVTLASVDVAPEPAGEGVTANIQTGDPEILLRVEGDPKTLFSGVCDVGKERSIISGRVPERFSYEDPGGEPFSCHIQKQDEGGGDLKVILLAGDTTRSIQQTSEKGDTITVSYTSPPEHPKIRLPF